MSTYFQVDTSSTGAWWFSGGLGDGLERIGQVSGQQLADAVDGVIGDLSQHRAEVEFRIEGPSISVPASVLVSGGFMWQ